MAGSKGNPSKKRKIENSDTMAAAPDQFTGFMVNSAKEWNKFTKEKV